MKLILLLISIVTFGCHSSEEQSKESTYLKAAAEELYADSLRYGLVNNTKLSPSEILIQEKVAYGPINFGITKTLFDSLYETLVSKTGSPILKIGEFHYGLIPHYSSAGRLFEVELLSKDFKTDNYNAELKDCWTNLYEVIATKYGRVAGEFLPSYKTEVDKTVFANFWKIGGKKIRLGILYHRSPYSGDGYQVDCFITDSKTEDQLLKTENDSLDKIHQAASKAI